MTALGHWQCSVTTPAISGKSLLGHSLHFSPIRIHPQGCNYDHDLPLFRACGKHPDRRRVRRPTRLLYSPVSSGTIAHGILMHRSGHAAPSFALANPLLSQPPTVTPFLFSNMDALRKKGCAPLVLHSLPRLVTFRNSPAIDRPTKSWIMKSGGCRCRVH